MADVPADRVSNIILCFLIHGLAIIVLYSVHSLLICKDVHKLDFEM